MGHREHFTDEVNVSELLSCINKFALPPSASCPVNKSTTKSVFLDPVVLV